MTQSHPGRAGTAETGSTGDAALPAPRGDSPPAVPWSRSEATRLLCAGVCLDSAFRGRVIEELVEQRQRTAAPSLGVDVVPVLAYALRCRQREVLTGLAMGLLWLAFFAVEMSVGDFPLFTLFYSFVCLLFWLARLVRHGRRAWLGTQSDSGSASRISRRRKVASWWLYYFAWNMVALYAVKVGAALFGDEEPSSPYDGYSGGYADSSAEGFLPGGSGSGAGFAGLLLPLLMTLLVWAYLASFQSMLRTELAKDAFARRRRAQLPTHLSALGNSIDAEQYASLTVYDPYEPFVGYGRPYETWSLAVELRRGKTLAADAPDLTARQVVELVMPKLAALRDSAAAVSRDRLRELEVEHLAYLPPAPRRGAAGYGRQDADRHIAEAVDEGGEARRYFLRVRVGAWSEQVVVSVLVRVHTQGRMLVLEVVPHVLYPVRAEYRDIDKLLARNAGSPLRTLVRALFATPATLLTIGGSTVRALVSVVRTWLHNPQALPGEGPRASVRELGSADEVSLFQEMDISRYVKTVQDRIASGVTQALEASGYETERFAQQIVNISEGALYIGAMSGGAVAQGSGAQAQSRGGAGRDD
ncbi:hypothetical protein ACFQLX_04295 [Streptomyces polyrhachis]|uniref:Uncharacterized protein n=1 Tax=Streptomyces polyrhachis TaxID=1282885 RepID=A0ABW2GEG0_9ACTN